MKGKFSGYPLTRWKGNRNMILEEGISFKNYQRDWDVPKGACINGATIPKPLWSIIGAPYVGDYRRASVVHDYFVGEGDNPDVNYSERRKADRMFFSACRTDGCSWFQSVIMYLGVSVGSWMNRKENELIFKELVDNDFRDKLVIHKFRELEIVTDGFQQTVPKSITDEEELFDRLEKTVEEQLKKNSFMINHKTMIQN